MMRMMFVATLITASAAAQALSCDMSGYKAQDGLKAEARAGTLELSWKGERREQLRAGFAIRGGQPVVQAPYGKVYHTTAAPTGLNLLNQEHGLVWQTHPRTKGSAGYPGAVRERDFFRSDRFLGGSFQWPPVDLSQKRATLA
jgi:hypothetical protein